MSHPERTPGASDGFEGGMAGLELSDLVQLNARNRFSGCFRVRHDSDEGLIFFRDGEIVHAEQGSRQGEDAFREMLAWPRGHFNVEPNVVTAQRTIHKTCEHLLLDAHRALDEHRAHRPEKDREPAPAPKAAATPLDVVRGVQGVADAVLLTREGKRLGEGGYEAEVLAGHTAYLAAAADDLGAFFQAGEMRAAAAEGEKQSLLVLVAKSHHLGVLVRPGADVGAVDAAIRAALTRSR
jgi:predicted regulator of Ras-like GTPase activity (Roadblock/LC7/MglB family)